MALNLSKIKAEASEDKKLEEITAENHKKITDGVAKHRKDLKEWFISLFPGKILNLIMSKHQFYLMAIGKLL
ncbi:hypothetical protein MKR65_08220 [Acinetobacter baumannii]